MDRHHVQPAEVEYSAAGSRTPVHVLGHSWGVFPAKLDAGGDHGEVFGDGGVREKAAGVGAGRGSRGVGTSEGKFAATKSKR